VLKVKNILIYIGLVGVGIFALQGIYKNARAISKDRKTKIRINEIMKEDGVGYEKAKEKLILEKLTSLKQFKVDSKTLKIGEQVLNRGNNVSFNTAEYGIIEGEFLGVSNANAVGYTINIIVAKKVDNELFVAPIEVIDVPSLIVYEG
jgi:hypothetical protein